MSVLLTKGLLHAYRSSNREWEKFDILWPNGMPATAQNIRRCRDEGLDPDEFFGSMLVGEWLFAYRAAGMWMLFEHGMNLSHRLSANWLHMAEINTISGEEDRKTFRKHDALLAALLNGMFAGKGGDEEPCFQVVQDIDMDPDGQTQHISIHVEAVVDGDAVVEEEMTLDTAKEVIYWIGNATAGGKLWAACYDGDKYLMGIAGAVSRGKG